MYIGKLHLLTAFFLISITSFSQQSIDTTSLPSIHVDSLAQIENISPLDSALISLQVIEKNDSTETLNLLDTTNKHTIQEELKNSHNTTFSIEPEGNPIINPLIQDSLTNFSNDSTSVQQPVLTSISNVTIDSLQTDSSSLLDTLLSQKDNPDTLLTTKASPIDSSSIIPDSLPSPQIIKKHVAFQDSTNNIPDSLMIINNIEPDSIEQNEITDSLEETPSVLRIAPNLHEEIIETPKKLPNDITLLVLVTDSISHLPIKARIIMSTMNGAIRHNGTGTCNSNGYFTFTLTPTSHFEITINHPGYVPITEEVDLLTNPMYEPILKKSYKMIKFKVGDVINLPNVNFKRGDFHLKREAFPVLDNLATMMLENPKMVIKLKGHTDNTGSAEANLKLSQERVNEARYYLLRKGIKVNRIKGQGYGGTHPLVPNNCIENLIKNRRVEFQIIRL